MTWVAVGIGGASLIGGLISSNAAKGAAQSQVNSQNAALGLQNQQFNKLLGLEQPYNQAGQSALGSLNYLLGNGGTPVAGQASGSLLQPFTASMMQQYSPAYQFQRAQGEYGTLAGSSSGQGALSGAAQQGLESFNQNMANTAFNNAFNQYNTQQNNIYSRLAGIASLGQSAASMQANTGTNLTGQMGQTLSNIGTAQAGGQVGSANAISGGSLTVRNLGLIYALNGGGGGGGGGITPTPAPNYGITGADSSGLGYFTPGAG